MDDAEQALRLGLLATVTRVSSMAAAFFSRVKVAGLHRQPAEPVLGTFTGWKNASSATSEHLGSLRFVGLREAGPAVSFDIGVESWGRGGRTAQHNR
ncbi:hypothetical protein ACIGB8_09055 [Promicromonospora sukumoe]|uniref:hypothetical protein n=1 Tax=Promicromonospora sukumoe TaxID=88382 RepID=UPI0037CC651A